MAMEPETKELCCVKRLQGSRVGPQTEWTVVCLYGCHCHSHSQGAELDLEPGSLKSQSELLPLSPAVENPLLGMELVLYSELALIVMNAPKCMGHLSIGYSSSMEPGELTEG